MRLPYQLSKQQVGTAGYATLRGGWLIAARVVWLSVAALSAGLFLMSIPAQLASFSGPDAATLAALARNGISAQVYALSRLGADIAVAAVFCAVGLLIFLRKSDERLALFVSFMLVTFGAQHNTDALLAALPGWSPVVSLLGALAWSSLGLFMYTFPDGHFVPGWTSVLAVIWVGWELPGLFFPDWPLGGSTAVGVTLQIGVWVTAILTQIYRYRRVSSPSERQQTKWMVFGFTSAFVVTLLLLALGALVPSFARADSLYQIALEPISMLVFLPIALALGIAVLRYRLWDIDPLINRTLVYGGLTAGVVAIYIVIVGYLGTVFRTGGNLPISLFATGIVAVIFHPFRARLQRGVNRLMYGERDEPYAVLTRLGLRLENTLAPDAVLPTIVATVREALKLPYVAICITHNGGEVLAAASGSAGQDILRLPLIYQHETVGALLLAPRSPGETFSPADQRLLDDLARQAGVAVHAVRLTSELQHLTVDLQRSREQIVSMREEERRRLRRDLHDGLGPALAGFSLTVGAARNLLRRDTGAADTLLAQLSGEIEVAVGDIKRLIYNLRPPALDELGLLGAIRARAAQLGAAAEATRVHVTVEAPPELPALPAAVEVAAYRIVQEALTNVARHAQARRCMVRLSCDDALRLEISDDGIGLAPAGAPKHTGVGLLSMHERAAELGGECVVERCATAGTSVRARLPLGTSIQEHALEE